MIRLPAVAGRFYPSDPAQLNQELDTFLTTETHKSKIRAQACMVPHAGYKYSGHVAGAVYSRIEIPDMRRSGASNPLGEEARHQIAADNPPPPQITAALL